MPTTNDSTSTSSDAQYTLLEEGNHTDVPEVSNANAQTQGQNNFNQTIEFESSSDDESDGSHNLAIIKAPKSSTYVDLHADNGYLFILASTMTTAIVTGIQKDILPAAINGFWALAFTFKATKDHLTSSQSPQHEKALDNFYTLFEFLAVTSMMSSPLLVASSFSDPIIEEQNYSEMTPISLAGLFFLPGLLDDMLASCNRSSTQAIIKFIQNQNLDRKGLLLAGLSLLTGACLNSYKSSLWENVLNFSVPLAVTSFGAAKCYQKGLFTRPDCQGSESSSSPAGVSNPFIPPHMGNV